MLALQTSRSSKSCTPNILPCRIHRNGPANAIEKYWAPSTQKDGSQTAYLRGRKLRSRKVRVPDGYQGVVVNSTERTLPAEPVDSMDPECEIMEDGEDAPEPVKVLEEAATFGEIMVWGHDMPPPADDPFAKGVEEWIAFATAMHLSGSAADKATSNT